MIKMAASESHRPVCKMNGVPSGDAESQVPGSSRKHGGWITFPFFIGTMTGLSLAAWGWMANLIVYLIEEFNMKSIDAAQVSNVVSGCTSLFPIIGAIIADSFLGCYSVISISSVVSLLGIALLVLTESLDSLKPQPCETGSALCKSPSKLQFAVLYLGIALASVGVGGTRFNIATMGANQYDEPQGQAIFFNWYFFAMYASSVIAATAIVFVQDNISWVLGFCLALAANLVGLAIFLLGTHYFRRHKPQGSPFTGLARVIVAAIRKRKAPFSSKSEDYYNEPDGITKMVASTPKPNFRFFNRAAVKTEGDMNEDGSITKPWRLCTVQQVEDFKTLLKIFPLWSTGIFLSTPIGIQSSLVVLQALAMDRHMGPHFKIPAGSFIVVVFTSTSIFLIIVDRLLIPAWKKLTNHSPTPLQQIGLGHVFNVLSMAVSAIVESRRLEIAHEHHLQDQPGSTVPMLALWLFPQLILVGVGECFHFPGQVALYYQEFPESLQSTATAMIALLIGIAFYLSAALIDLVRRVTTWLPDNINNGRLDNMYWALVVVGVVNFCYYLVCAKLYKYQNLEKKVDGGSGSQN